MKMRFSTTHDYNCHQRAKVIECVHAVQTRACVLKHVHNLLQPTRWHLCFCAHLCVCVCVCVLKLSVYISSFFFFFFMCSSVYFTYKPTLPLCAYGCSHCVCVCVCACVHELSLNLPHLCLLKYIYMKRQLTFLSCLKPWRGDILLTVAGDILPHFPR